MHYALLAFLIILVFVQAFLVYKNTSVWQWYDLVAVMMTMILSVVFVFPVAGVLKSRSAWHAVKRDLDEQLKKVQLEQLELKYGDPNNPVGEDGVLPLAQKLAKLASEAGRRWRDLQLANANFGAQTSITLNRQVDAAAAADEDADPGDDEGEAAPEIPLIPQGMVVYGFAETQLPIAELPVPTFYLGEFRVTSSSPNSVTITTTGPLLPRQRQAIEARQASRWSLYELLPLDGHEPFIAEGSKPDDDSVFGRIDDQLIGQILGPASEETRKNYLRDGSRSLPDDPPLTRWVKVEFIKKHSIVVDSPDQRGALDGGFFDGSGRAVDGRLQQGEGGKVSFDKGTLLIVKEEAADTLQDEGVARLVDTYYMRPMNDYRFVLRRIRLRLAELKTRTVELNYEHDVLQKAVDATVNMLSEYQTDKLKLEQDLQQTEAEAKAIESYNQDLRADVKATTQKLVRLYQSNQSAQSQLKTIHERIQRQVDSLTSVQ